MIPVGTQRVLTIIIKLTTVRSWNLFTPNRDREIKNVHLLRFAEVLLLMNAWKPQHKSEAMQATPLNMVRARAGLPPVGFADQNAVWQERRVELAMEHDRF